MTEEWRPIPQFEGYEVSDRGRVRSFLGRGSGSGQLVGEPRILTQQKTRNGYLRVSLVGPGGRSYPGTHRLVAMAFVPGRKEGLLVCHNDSVKTNNIPSNLRWDTPTGNAYDCSRMGDIPRQVLNEAQVREIRDLYETGNYTHRSLASDFGVTHQAIRDVLIRKNYRWVS